MKPSLRLAAGTTYSTSKRNSENMRLALAILIGLAIVLPGTAARAGTISGTIVDVSQYVTGVRSTMTMNADMMMRMMGSAHGGMMNGSNSAAMGGPDGNMIGGSGGIVNGEGGSGSVHSHDATAATPAASPLVNASAVPMPMLSGMQGGMSSTTMHVAGIASGMHSMNISQMMERCGTIGVLTKSGTLYLLMTTSSAALRPLCSEVGRTATVTGSTYAKGGMHAIVASAVQLR